MFYQYFGTPVWNNLINQSSPQQKPPAAACQDTEVFFSRVGYHSFLDKNATKYPWLLLSLQVSPLKDTPPLR
jgi:hypothetical protein